jgi:hypothetical protein
MNIKRFTFPAMFSLVAVTALVAIAQQLRHSYASDAPITEPKIFAEGVISTEDFDDYFAFTPDGQTIYFTKHSVDFGSPKSRFAFQKRRMDDARNSAFLRPV